MNGYIPFGLAAETSITAEFWVALIELGTPRSMYHPGLGIASEVDSKAKGI